MKIIIFFYLKIHVFIALNSPTNIFFVIFMEKIIFVIFRPITVIPPPSAVSHIQKPVPPPRLHPDQQLQQQHQMPTASPRRESLARTRTPSPKPSFFQVFLQI